MRILNVVGARPNFMKVAPIHRQMRERRDIFEPILIHTGQHYDERMSQFFFNDLGLPEPDVFLGVGSGSHAEQTAKIMIEFEKVCLQYKPDLVLVVGDVNSTAACSLVASKLWIPVAHVEAGLRSFDRQMPEEINRLVTDALSDYLFITEKSGRENLLKEGIAENKIHFVGNCMIDSLVGLMEKAEQSDIMEKLKIKERQFLLVTLHRPSNVDELENFSKIFEALEQIQKTVKTVFPIHPRTKKNIKTFGLEKKVKALKNLLLTEPLGYLDFIKLEKYCTFVLTDSGGLQEESTYMGVPCLTVRKNTERPITVELGTNEIVGLDTRKIIDSAQQILAGKWKKGEIPPLWDGRAAERIVEVLVEGRMKRQKTKDKRQKMKDKRQKTKDRIYPLSDVKVTVNMFETIENLMSNNLMNKNIISDHFTFIDELQYDIYRKMSGADKLKTACRLYWSARFLKTSALRKQHPQWSEEQIMKEVRKVFNYA